MGNGDIQIFHGMEASPSPTPYLTTSALIRTSPDIGGIQVEEEVDGYAWANLRISINTLAIVLAPPFLGTPAIPTYYG